MPTLHQLRELKGQFLRSLADLGLVRGGRSRGSGFGDADLNVHNTHERMVKAVLCAGLWPNVVRVVPPAATYAQTEHGAVAREGLAKNVKFFGKDGSRVFLHPASLNFDHGQYEHLQLLFHEKVKTSKVFLRDSTMVSACPILFFGGELLVSHEAGILTVDGWLRYEAPARVAVLINKLRAAIDRFGAMTRGATKKEGAVAECFSSFFPSSSFPHVKSISFAQGPAAKV